MNGEICPICGQPWSIHWPSLLTHLQDKHTIVVLPDGSRFAQLQCIGCGLTAGPNVMHLHFDKMGKSDFQQHALVEMMAGP